MAGDSRGWRDRQAGEAEDPSTAVAELMAVGAGNPPPRAAVYLFGAVLPGLVINVVATLLK